MSRTVLLQALTTAKSAETEAKRLRMGGKPHSQNWLQSFDDMVTDAALRQATRQLFSDGHYAQAVEEAYKCVNNEVKRRSGLSADGSSLMKTAFSLNNPVLKLNALTTQSQRDQQLGYMEIFSGCMTGIRNPRAHEHRYLDQPEVALEILTWANHLLRILAVAKRRRGGRNRQAAR